MTPAKLVIIAVAVVLAAVVVLLSHRRHELSETVISAEPPRPVGALTSAYSTSLPAIEAGVVRGAYAD